MSSPRSIGPSFKTRSSRPSAKSRNASTFAAPRPASSETSRTSRSSANADDRARAALSVLEEKLIRRKVSLKHLDPKPLERGPKGSTRLPVGVKEGIEQDKAREIVKLIKDSKLKVQASIHEDSVRVSGKKRDDLQEAIAFLRRADSLGLDLQFNNFRD
ncbi:MAG: DUF520 family protein [Polyangiaceae bacterium]